MPPVSAMLAVLVLAPYGGDLGSLSRAPAALHRHAGENPRAALLATFQGLQDGRAQAAKAAPADATEPEGGAPPDGAAAVPEATTLLLVGTGLVGLALSARRRRRLGDLG